MSHGRKEEHGKKVMSCGKPDRWRGLAVKMTHMKWEFLRRKRKKKK
jgi:hypothetical protein